MMRAATFFNQMLFMDELYRKVTLHSSSVAEISSLNSRRFILEELALELFPAGWNVAAPCCVLYGEIHEPRTNDAHLRKRYRVEGEEGSCRHTPGNEATKV